MRLMKTALLTTAMVTFAGMALAQTAPATQQDFPAETQEMLNGLKPALPMGDVLIWGQEGADEYVFWVPEVGFIFGFPYTVTGEPIVPVYEAAATQGMATGNEISDLLASIESWDAPERDKAAARQLLGAVGNAQTPEELEKALIDWRTANAGAFSGEAAPTAAPVAPVDVQPGQAGQVFTPQNIVPTPANPGAQPAAPAFGGQAAEAQPLPQITAQQPQVQQAQGVDPVALHADLQNDSFWIGVGNAEAPPVYVLIDPSCPHCAQIVQNMRPAVEAGQIQMRAVLMPFMSRLSLDLATDILVSGNPAQAILDNAHKRINQGPFQSTNSFDNLPKEFQDEISGNIDILTKHRVPGVPMTIFNSANGPQAVFGVPNDAPWLNAVK